MTRGAIHRDVRAASQRPHDLIVIGGGIYGACVLLEAARRGLRGLLLEKRDFGAGVSRSSLRIIHGGLRYLQSLDLPRSRQSAREQAWFLSTFPDLVRPLPCILPLDGRGPRRPSAFRCALTLARLLGHPAHTSVAGPTPGVLAPACTSDWLRALGLPAAHPAGVWHDAVMTCPERLLIEIIRWSCARGAEALNDVEPTGLLTSANGAVAGVRARDLAAGTGSPATAEFHAPVVINCAGPWCREVAARLDRDHPDLFAPSLAFNLLLDAPPPCPAAVAVRRPQPGARTYFLVPCHGRLLAGTYHDPCAGDRPGSEPTQAQVARFLADLNAAAPGLDLSGRSVLAVLGGLLPALARGSARQAERPRILHHTDLGGPAGLWSVSGVKYTTARAVAARAIAAAFPGRPYAPGADRPAARAWPGLLDPSGPGDAPDAAAHVRRAVAEESALHLDDLVLRRTAWGLVPAHALAAGRRAADMLGWDAPRRDAELRRLALTLGLRPPDAPADPGVAPDPRRPAAAVAHEAAP